MKCSFCGYEFSEMEGKSACQGCLIKGCCMVRCPNCNFENAADTKSLKSIKRGFEKWKQLMKKKKKKS